MCGIAGFNWRAISTIAIMTDVMKYRGPDDEGFYVDDNVSLGQRRLAVIDTSCRGHQPMEFANLVIAYNGEIYNYKELREQLISHGYAFLSDTDTEVVLYSYHLWGPSCVDKFNGMWAFCIYDKEKHRFFLSRDRFGIKPLYYYFDGERFIFASSLLAIRRHNLDLGISKPALNFFFYQKYIGDNLTIFENCYKVRPSENLAFDLNLKRLTLTKYYDLEDRVSGHTTIPLRTKLELIENLLVDAVERRLVADVPVGGFLSGGVDSSLMSAIVSKKHEDFETFSIGFKDKSYDELEYSKLTSEHIRVLHHYDFMSIDNDIIDLIIDNMDEPFGDSSLLPTYLLSKMARGKVTVSLSGDGADEVFGGYDTYKAYKIARYAPPFLVRSSRHLINLLPPSDRKVTLAFKMQRFARDFGGSANRRHLDWMATFNDSQRSNLLNGSFVPAEDIIGCSRRKSFLSIQLNDIQNYLAGDILKKVDLASMLNSLEVRIPFLDHRLVPLVLALDECYKLKRLETKWLLKRIAAKYLPKRIVYRAKRGFTVPISKWIRENCLLREYLTNRKYYDHGLLDYGYVTRLFDSHCDNTTDNARHLWLVFVFNYWMYKRSKATVDSWRQSAPQRRFRQSPLHLAQEATV
jgi:asparagine synthase (glutamine-hydrolysing)